MNRLTIPGVEALDDFDRIQIISETVHTLKFIVLGKTVAFGAAANDFFANNVPLACFDGKDCHLYRCNRDWIVGSNQITIECDRPVFA